MLADYSPEEISRILEKYESDDAQQWLSWVHLHRSGEPEEISEEFSGMLRKWKACRPYRVRRSRKEKAHRAPFMDDILDEAASHLDNLSDFELAGTPVIGDSHARSLGNLRNIFKHLCYKDSPDEGKAGIVGISKATMMLTDGRIGPVFDSIVREKLKTGDIPDAESWIAALEAVGEDIHRFEVDNGCSLRECIPAHLSEFHTGMIYDIICMVA